MRVLLSWLRELVELPADTNEVARRLTMAGLEIEKIERLDHGLDKVVVGEVRAKTPIEGTKLNVCKVFTGDAEHQIVCGAQNYVVGDHVPAALIGAKLPNGVAIGAAKLRGVESFGMLCSSKELSSEELDWNDGVDGLMILPRETVPGTPIAKVIGRDDIAFEVNVTPNRGDALSHLGVSRDLSVLFNAPIRLPSKPPPAASGKSPAAIEIAATDLCTRFHGQVIEGVKVGPSPMWLQNRLRGLGQRPINNIVDASNYVMLELGQPTHAYDLDRIAGLKLVARRANPGETLRTLDGKDRLLNAEDLVIADTDRAVGLAGVMGGEDSEVKTTTTRIVLEAAHFAPSTVRRTAKRYDLHSAASHRFERGVDPENVGRALQRLTSLILELAGGTLVGAPVETVAAPYKRAEVTLRKAQLATLLGVEVPWNEANRILVALGLEQKSLNDSAATYAIPGFRSDITSEPDLIEEVVRIFGFDKVPVKQLSGSGVSAAESPTVTATHRLRQALSAAGFDEAVNFAFASAKDLEILRPDVKPIVLKNALRAGIAVMRTTLVAGLLRNVEHNLRHGVALTRSYELGRIYEPFTAAQAAQFGEAHYQVARELKRLAIVAVGPRGAGWTGGKDAFDFYDLKGAVEEVLDGLAIRTATFKKATVSWMHPRSSAEVINNGVRLGVLGELHPLVASAFELPRGVLVAELDADLLLSQAQLNPLFKGIPKFPASLRDVAIVVDETVSAAEVVATMRQADAQGLLQEALLFDVYTGANIPAGRKSLAFALRYRSPDRTLTDDEVTTLHKAIVERLGSVYGAALRT